MLSKLIDMPKVDSNPGKFGRAMDKSPLTIPPFLFCYVITHFVLPNFLYLFYLLAASLMRATKNTKEKTTLCDCISAIVYAL